ncbi:hypothetical protein [Bacillus paranthracis]|uniref:hypothetical protein n=1 Tax=Bacillus paranthracis TaxID=2026186 RepID=UPI003D660022
MNIEEEYNRRTQREKVEDSHTRRTFLVRKDLLAKLDELSEGKHGFKTLVINKALEEALRQLEG